MCVYVIMLIFLCILCYYVYSVKSSREMLSACRTTTYWAIPGLNQTFKVVETVFSSEMVRKVVPQSCSCKHEWFFAIRFVYDDYTSSYINLLEKALVPSLQIRRIRTMTLETYKIVNKLAPVCLHDLEWKCGI
jgi:hypothetical protein